MDIISRKDAKEQGLRFYFTGKPCKNGHLTKRLVRKCVCVLCKKEERKSWKKRNPEKRSEERSKWKKNNLDKMNSYNAKRKAAKIQRTPTWVNYEDVAMWYEVATVLSRSGVNFDVDHVVPLQGDTVSGLHVQNNVQVLPAYLNRSKNNKWNWDTQSHE